MQFHFVIKPVAAVSDAPTAGIANEPVICV